MSEKKVNETARALIKLANRGFYGEEEDENEMRAQVREYCSQGAALILKLEAELEKARKTIELHEERSVDINVYDQEEIVENCTVQILTNSVTGKRSIAWWHGSAEDCPTIGGCENG